MEGLQQLLRESTVKILSAEREFIGSGFFISSNKLLTALHNLQGQTEVIIEYPSTQNSFTVSVNQKREYNYDFAIVEVDFTIPIQASYIGSDFSYKNNFRVYGYSASNESGDSITVDFEGMAIQDKSSVKKYKVKSGQIDKGISGAPVLCVESGQVVGIVVETRERNKSAGGYFISIADILRLEPNLLTENRAWHLENPKWNLTKDKDNFHNLFDETWKTDHFKVFPNEILNVEDLYIDPEFYEIMFDGEFDKKPFTSSIIKRSLELLDSQSFLMITGPYGSGKSILTKCIQKELIRQGRNTLYINGSYISNDEAAAKDFIVRKLSIERELYVMIDAFDELNYMHSEKVFDFLMMLGNAINVKSGYLIVNFRSLESQDDKNQYETLCDIFKDRFASKKVDFIKLSAFSSLNVRQWQDNYSSLMKKNTHLEKEFTTDLLHAAHKNLIIACHNPLFLYIVGQDFYLKDNLLHSIGNVYDIYATFVKSTIRGKFSIETNLGTRVLKGAIGAYTDFLKEMALRIAKHSKKFTIGEDKDLDDHLLDDNTEVFGITGTEVGESVNSIILPFIQNKEHDVKIDHKFLNCYFFEQSGNIWRFRDNNILFFFLAEKIYTSLTDAMTMLKNGNESTSVIFKKIENISEVPLHPIILEMLLNKINSIDREDKKHLVSLLRIFIDEEYFLSISTIPTSLHLDFKKINLDVFLCILFIQLNENGYKGISFFFKRYMWLLSIAKRLNPNMVFLAKRFFKGAKIYDAEFLRVNLEGCNFDDSELKKVSFIQNKIHFVRKNNSRFKAVTYSLCDFHKSYMENICGDIHFENCTIKILYMKMPSNELTLLFRGCKIKELKIFEAKKFHINLRFENCIIENLFISNANQGTLELKHNIINSITIEKSTVHYTNKGNVLISNNPFKFDTSKMIEAKYE